MFDPSVTTYERLLQVFWSGFRPRQGGYGTQYRNAIFTLNEGQRRIAEGSKARLERGENVKLDVSVEDASAFWSAEDYHQKYYLRGDRELMAEFHAMYPDEQGFADSTAAARVNGYLGGYGDPRRDLDRLGLSLSGGRRVLDAALRRARFTCA